MALVNDWMARIGMGARTPWVRTVAVLAVCQVVSELAFSFALPFTPLYVQELGVSDPTQAGLWAGLMAGVFAIGWGGMGPVWGIVADRFGHRLMIQRASFGAGVVIALMAFVQTPEQLVVLRLFHGALTGVVTAMATLVSLTVPPRYLTTVFGMMQACIFVGISLGPVLGGLFADQFGMRASFAMTGALLFATGGLVTLFVQEPARERRQRETGPAAGGERLLQRDLVVAVMLIAIVRFASMAPMPVLPLFVQQLTDSPERLATEVGIVLAAAGIASTVSALLVGQMAGRFGRKATLLVFLALATVLSPLHAIVATVWQLVAVRTAMGLAIGALSPAIQSLLVDAAPAGRRGAAFGYWTMANAFGNGAGPVIGSLVAAGHSVPALFIVTAPVYAIAGWLIARRR